MRDGEEVELKLQLGLADIATLLADPVFADHDPVAHDQLSVYFDTKDHALHSAGLSLRIRNSAGKRIQTIKTESKVAASLFARGEWERSVEHDIPDLGDVPAIIDRALGKKQRNALKPAFTVEIHRTAVIHQTGRDRIELVADQGRCLVDEQESAIVELELELIDGRREALFDLAHRLADIVPLRLGVATKSERGYALASGAEKRLLKAEPISLSSDSDTASLFETVAGACIRQFRLNEDRLLISFAPAALHQARVALRRLRSVLSTFKVMLEGPELERFQQEFRALAAALGTVRDVDVMIEKIDDAPALEKLRAARDQRFGAVVKMLNGQEIRVLMLDFVEWLSIGAWRDREDASELRATPAAVTAARMLDKLWRRIKRQGEHLAALEDHDRHRVRISGKKLRYTAEFFVDLYHSKKAVHRHAHFLTKLEELQTALGHLNDLASGRALFDALGIADANAILAMGKQADSKRLLATAEQAHHDLIGIKRFWR